ncbi:hypothetical protein L3Q82_007386 [Scortum barcoo]|uniref:Uncharacterized protein n=1 Tax=Scortum barcoo TaxID=214431 RepID=A0ACB8WTE1_9TELE|nr:hypothetical protein L3Q82_007386 [Scortum barcoo]
MSPVRGQQLPTCTVNSVGRVLLPPSEAPDGLPESLRGRPIVLLHGLTELLPDPSFCLQDRPGKAACLLGLPVPVNCVRSPTGQHGPIGLLLQPDGIPYFRCPPPGSGLPPRQAPETLRPQLRTMPRRQWRQRTWSTLDSMSPASLGICEKLFRRWELKTSLTEGSARRSQQTLNNTFGSARTPLEVQIGEAVPPDHAPPGTPRRPCTLYCCSARSEAQTTARDPIPNPKAQEEATLSFTGVNSNTWRLSWGAISKPTPATPPLTLGNNSRVVEGPAPLKELGSRAQAMRGGIGSSRPPPPRLLPKPHCTGPSWTFPAGGEPTEEGGPTSPFRAEPGRDPATRRSPCEPQPQAWLQGGAPGNANPGATAERTGRCLSRDPRAQRRTEPAPFGPLSPRRVLSAVLPWRDVAMLCTRRTKTLVSTCVILSGMTNIVCLLYVGWITNYVANGGHKVTESGGGEAERKLEEDSKGETLRIIERLDRLESVVNEHIKESTLSVPITVDHGLSPDWL